MAGEFNNYVLQQRPIQPLLDLGIVQNTLATITAGNKEALQKTSELKTAIANLDLNEAEDGYKEGLYNEIEKTIDDNAIEGNAYYALDDIIKKQGDIASNPGLLGRVNAQQAYKSFRAQIDERLQKGDIDVDTAEWAKEQNPYHYKDNYKKNQDGTDFIGPDGNKVVVGGTEWTPNMVPTSTLDMNEIYAMASKYIVPKKGSIDNATFINPETGEMSTKYKPGMSIFNQVTGNYEMVTEKMVRDAIDLALQANPQYAAQMNQNYQVALWKHKKDPTAPNAAYDGTRELSFNEYKNNLINPFINTQVRNTRIARTTWYGASKEIANSGNSNSGSKNGKSNAINIKGNDGDSMLYDLKDSRSVSGFNINLPTRYFDSSVMNVFQKGRSIAEKLDIPITEIPTTFDEFMHLSYGKPEYSFHMPTAQESIQNALTKNLSKEAKDFLGVDPNLNRMRLTVTYSNAKPLTTEEYYDFKNFYDLYGPELEMFKKPEHFSDEGVIDFVSSVIKTSSGIDALDVSDPRIKRYKDLYGEALNSVFDGEDSITYNCNNNIEFSDKKRLSSLGINVSGNKITLNKDNPDAAYAFFQYIQEHLNGKFDLSKNEELQNQKDEELMMESGGNYIPKNSFEQTPGFNTHARPYFDFLNKLEKEDKQEIRIQEVKDNVLIPDPTILLNTISYNGLSIADTIGNTVLEMTGESKVKTMTNAAAENILGLAKSGNIIDHDVFIQEQDENGKITYRLATREEKLKIRNELGPLNLSDVTGNLSYIDGFEFRPGLAYSRYKYNEKTTNEGNTTFTKDPNPETINIILGDGFTDPELNKLNSANYLQIGSELTNCFINGGAINIGKLGLQPISIKSHNPSGENNYDGNFDIYMGNDYSKTISAEEAIPAIIAYRMMINDREHIPFTGDDSEDSALIGQYFQQRPDILNTLINLYGSLDSVLQIATDIFTK